jgi:glycosyltransferase involved in cell wall biosynthesis
MIMSNFAIVLLAESVFGGAERRFINLFLFLQKNTDHHYFLITNSSLYERINQLYPEENKGNILLIDSKNKRLQKNRTIHLQTIKVGPKKNIIKVFLKRNLIYKFYYYFKHQLANRSKYNKINVWVKAYNITALLGVFNGIIPLYLYLKHNIRPGIIFCDMDSWFSNISEDPVHEWYKKFVLFNYAFKKVDLIDFLSPFILNGVREKGVRIMDEKIRITPGSFTDYGKCRIGDKSKIRIAFASRMEKDKNPVLFTRVSIELAGKYPEAEFHIMGEGNLSIELTRLIEESGFSNVVFHGFYPNPIEIFENSIVFVSIQNTNNYPSQSVLEAMACGNAIIASDVGDTRLFINENNGTLILTEFEALKQAMEFYIVNPNIAKEKGTFAAKFVRENYTVEKSCQYFTNLFEEVSNYKKRQV